MFFFVSFVSVFLKVDELALHSGELFGSASTVPNFTQMQPIKLHLSGPAAAVSVTKLSILLLLPGFFSDCSFGWCVVVVVW